MELSKLAGGSLQKFANVNYKWELDTSMHKGKEFWGNPENPTLIKLL